MRWLVGVLLYLLFWFWFMLICTWSGHGWRLISKIWVISTEWSGGGFGETKYPLLHPCCHSGSRWPAEWCSGGIRPLADFCHPALFPCRLIRSLVAIFFDHISIDREVVDWFTSWPLSPIHFSQSLFSIIIVQCSEQIPLWQMLCPPFSRSPSISCIQVCCGCWQYM